VSHILVAMVASDVTPALLWLRFRVGRMFSVRYALKSKTPYL